MSAIADVAVLGETNAGGASRIRTPAEVVMGEERGP